MGDRNVGLPETLGAGTTVLPPDLLARVRGRLRVASAACAVLFALVIPVANITRPAAGHNLAIANGVALFAIAISAAVFFLSSRPLAPSRLIDVGLVYEVLAGWGIATAETFATYDPGAVVRGVSWLCLWIVVYPLIVPSTPGKTLVASFATACMGPLAILLVVAGGMPLPPPASFALLVVPSFATVALALLFSRVVYRLTADVSRARELGSYRLEELLGRGGMGEVWRASHRMLARPAAIKLVNPQALGNAGSEAGQAAMRRFEREANATAQLTSQHTITLFDFGVTDTGALYYVMELLEGVDLETLVAEHGPVPPERVTHFLAQVCESLTEAHAHGLIHRDVKPANIYVCRLGTQYDCIKVLDFGLVSQHGAGPADASRLTAEGTITGTPAYLAPECVTGDHDLDARTDIYALGCVAYYMLTGKLVFEGDTPLQLAFAHVEKEPQPPSAVVGELPEALDAIVLRCLAKNPDDRPASAHELQRALESLDIRPWSRLEAREWWRAHPVRASQPPAEARRVLQTVVPRFSSMEVARTEEMESA